MAVKYVYTYMYIKKGGKTFLWLNHRCCFSVKVNVTNLLSGMSLNKFSFPERTGSTNLLIKRHPQVRNTTLLAIP